MSSAAGCVLQAAEQIDRALREAQGPVECLGASITRLFSILCVAPEEWSCEVASSRLSGEGPWQQLRLHAQQAVVSLQYHDRLVQHLGCVREHLVEMGANLGAAGSCDHPVETPWRHLEERLPRRAGGGSVELF